MLAFVALDNSVFTDCLVDVASAICVVREEGYIWPISWHGMGALVIRS